MESKGINKTKLVERILNEIGATGESPPYDWKRMVDEKLLKEGVDPTKVNSYAIRQRLKKEYKNANYFMACAPIKCQQEVPTIDEISTTLQPLVELRNLIKKFGGKDNFLRYLDLMEKLSV